MFLVWIGHVESFFCSLSSCTFNQEFRNDRNITVYQCPDISCQCRAGEMLCGKDGGVDITDFLKDEIHGPATFKCADTADCGFQEPAMNQLIKDIFGDPQITLNCKSGECMHYTQVPGFERPSRPENHWLILASISGAALIILFVLSGIF